MISTKSLKKLGLLGCLYVSQFLPTAFLYQALPVFMRQQGVSLKAISFLSLLILPSALNFLWSPLLDRYSFTLSFLDYLLSTFNSLYHYCWRVA
jgi:MFS transporter, PAT family, beta-lactamase induction signal transducer AmpG